MIQHGVALMSQRGNKTVAVVECLGFVSRTSCQPLNQRLAFLFYDYHKEGVSHEVEGKDSQ